uniref:Laminin G domain-containing protein n=1 Tax=Eptatretus burgeri TaxID=7764 RepID=A0A8C4R810_EPTBU
MMQPAGQGTLIVNNFDDDDDENKENVTGSSPGRSTGLNLHSSSKIYFGGFPANHNVRPEVTKKGFSGCLRDADFNRAYMNLLQSPDTLGVRKGCTLDAAHSSSIRDGGFVQIPADNATLGVDSEISLSFSTLNQTGLLLVALGTPSSPHRRAQVTPYYTMTLLNGRVLFQVRAATGRLTSVNVEPASGTYHDGRDHSLTISRHRGYIKIEVDEVDSNEARFNLRKDLLVQKVFVGGVPGDLIVPSDLLKTRQSFVGCIRNLVINAVLTDFAKRLAFERTDIGHCVALKDGKDALRFAEKLAEIDAISKLPVPATSLGPKLDPPAEPVFVRIGPPATVDWDSLEAGCAAVIPSGTLIGAKHFGRSKHSYVALTFDDTKVKKSLKISLDLRTHATDGLIMYMARINHADFVSVQLHEGKLRISYDLGSGPTSHTSQELVNDEEWHTVSFARHDAHANVTLDGKKVATMLSPRKATILDVVGRVYIGGLPHTFSTSRIGKVTHSIAGCIKNFIMNGKKMDLDQPESSNDVDVCYVNTERGAYFEGTGFAKFVEKGYHVGTDLNIKLEFRTFHKDGVIFGISHDKMKDSVGLELVNGKLVFQADNGPGAFTAISEALPLLCDGRWHTVVASKQKHQLFLNVDGSRTEATSSVPQSTAVDTNNPVFIGGFPDAVKQHALQQNTSFRGCIRNIELQKPHMKNGLVLNLSDATVRRGVIPTGCMAA